MGNFEDWHLELSQSCLVHGYLRFEPKVPAYIERVKGESLLQYMDDNKTPAT